MHADGSMMDLCIFLPSHKLSCFPLECPFTVSSYCKCDFPLSVVSVTSLMEPVETPECAVPFAAL